MPTYNHKDLNVFIADALSPRLPISALLSNMASFHVKLFDIKQEGVLFAVSSPDYSMSLGMRDGAVHFARNRFVASKAIGPMTQSFQILLAWKLDALALALIVDNEDRGCSSVDTPILVVPPTVIRRARTQPSASCIICISVRVCRLLHRRAVPATPKDRNVASLLLGLPETRRLARKSNTEA
jgi:hypothetical protein